MNQEDKKRFERYRKGYISQNEDEIINGNSSNTSKNTKIGYIDKIDINKNILITDIITTNKYSKNNT
jgi:hypothetical protein